MVLTLYKYSGDVNTAWKSLGTAVATVQDATGVNDTTYGGFNPMSPSWALDTMYDCNYCTYTTDTGYTWAAFIETIRGTNGLYVYQGSVDSLETARRAGCLNTNVRLNRSTRAAAKAYQIADPIVALDGIATHLYYSETASLNTTGIIMVVNDPRKITGVTAWNMTTAQYAAWASEFSALQTADQEAVAMLIQSISVCVHHGNAGDTATAINLMSPAPFLNGTHVLTFTTTAKPIHGLTYSMAHYLSVAISPSLSEYWQTRAAWKINVPFVGQLVVTPANYGYTSISRMGARVFYDPYGGTYTAYPVINGDTIYAAPVSIQNAFRVCLTFDTALNQVKSTGISMLLGQFSQGVAGIFSVAQNPANAVTAPVNIVKNAIDNVNSYNQLIERQVTGFSGTGGVGGSSYVNAPTELHKIFAEADVNVPIDIATQRQYRGYPDPTWTNLSTWQSGYAEVADGHLPMNGLPQSIVSAAEAALREGVHLHA